MGETRVHFVDVNQIDGPRELLRAEVARLERERDEARAEVDRLRLDLAESNHVHVMRSEAEHIPTDAQFEELDRAKAEVERLQVRLDTEETDRLLMRDERDRYMVDLNRFFRQRNEARALLQEALRAGVIDDATELVARIRAALGEPL